MLAAAVASWFGFRAMNQVMPLAGCAIGFEAIDDSLKTYVREHNGKLPPADKWQDELRPYVKKELVRLRENSGPFDMKVMDPEKPWGCSAGDGQPETGIAFNDEVAGKKIDDVSEATPIVFEVTDKPAANLHMKYVKQDVDKARKLMGQSLGWGILTKRGFDFEGAESDSGFGSSSRERDQGWTTGGSSSGEAGSSGSESGASGGN